MIPYHIEGFFGLHLGATLFYFKDAEILLVLSNGNGNLGIWEMGSPIKSYGLNHSLIPYAKSTGKFNS